MKAKETAVIRRGELFIGDGETEYVLMQGEAGDGHIFAPLELYCFPEDPWSAEMFESSLANPGCTALIVQNRQMTKIVAYGVLYSAADEADIANIAVMPDCRKQGIGRALLSKMIEIARSGGASRIFLEVRESNAPAQRLYKSAGFVEIGRRRKYYSSPTEDAIVMALCES